MTDPIKNQKPPALIRIENIKEALQEIFRRAPLQSFREFESRLPMLPFTSQLDSAMMTWEQFSQSVKAIRGKYTMAEGDFFSPASELSVALFRADLNIQVECVPGIDMIGPTTKHAPPHLFIVASVSHFFYILYRHAWEQNFSHTNEHMNAVFSALRSCALTNPLPMQHVFHRPYVVQIIPNKPSLGEVLRLLTEIGRLSPYTIAARGAQGHLAGVKFATPYTTYFGERKRTARYHQAPGLEVTSRNGALSTPPELDYWRFPFFPVAIFPEDYNMAKAVTYQEMDTDPLLLRGILINANTWLLPE